MKEIGVHGETIITGNGRKTLHFTTKEGKKLKVTGLKYAFYDEHDFTHAGMQFHQDSILLVWLGHSANNYRKYKNVTNVWED